MSDNNNIDPLDKMLGDRPNQISLAVDDILQQQGILTPDQYGTNAPSRYAMSNRYAGNLSQPPELPSPDDMNAYMLNSFQTAPSHAANPYKMGANTYYDASYTGANFARYYTHPAFEKLDFNPWRNNDSYYNQNSTPYEDWQRGNDQFFNLMWSGIKSGFRSWGDMFTGRPMSPDLETAEEQAKAMAVGYSSRGGVGAFTNNLILNSAHTFGILAEMAMEEAALLGVGALTGGSTFGLGASRFASGMGRIAKGLPVNKFGNAVKSTTKAFKGLNDVSTARQFWKNLGRGAGRFINPFERTFDYVKGFRNADNITEFTKAHSFFGSFYRDVREINFALAESKLEGGLVANEVSAKLFNDFYQENGKNPTSEEAREIAETGQKAGFATVGWNLPVILFSNRIVFDNMFRGFRPYTKAGGGALEHALGARLVYNRKAAKKGLDDVFSFQEKNFKNLAKSVYMPGTYGRIGLSYFKANFAEGIQETMQEIIGGTATDYYTELYKNDPARGGIYTNIANNISKQYSQQGFEIFMSGFLMGGLVQPIIKIPTYSAKALEYMSDKEGYKAKNAKRKEDRDKVAEQLNQMYADPFKYFAPDMENMSLNRKLASAMNEAERNGDRKAWQDLKDESIYNHVVTAIQTGKMNFYRERLEGMKNMSNEELKEAYGYSLDKLAVSKKDFHAKIDKTIERSKRIEARYEYVSKRFTNPFNANKFDFGSKEWEDEGIRQLAYDKALKRAVFMTHSFDRALERMDSIYQDISTDIPVSKAKAHDFNLLFDSKDESTELALGSIYKEIELLKKEVEQFSEGDQTFKAVKKSKQLKLDALKELKDSIEEYKNNLEEESITNAKVEAGQLEFDFDQVKKQMTSKEKLFDKYKNYLEVIAKINSGHVFNEDIEASFEKLADYYKLENESINLTNSVNILLDPSGAPMINSARREASIMKETYKRKKEDIAHLLNLYEDISDDNGLFQSLYEAGYFFDPDDAQAFKTDKILPATFYRVTDLEEITQDTHPEDWVKILEIVNKWSEVTGKPIPEARADTRYDPRGRSKYKNDKRTYKDYAEQFGFDPDSAESTVLQRVVLQSIIDSGSLSTPREKKLAAALLMKTNATDTIKFVNNLSTPGVYDTESGDVYIDVRYSSIDYTAGQNAIEHTILHEIIHRLTVKGLRTDTEYRTAIEEIWKKTVDYYLANTGKIGIVPYGLKDIEEFVAEAMTNDNFQKLLKEIKWDDAKTSAWQEFLKAVTRFLNKALGIKTGNTVLDQTIALTTEYIDQTNTGKQDPKDNDGPDLGFTPDTKIEDLPAPLIEQLKKGLETHNKRKEAIDEKPIGLKEYIENTNSAAVIIAKYNQSLKTDKKKVKKKSKKLSKKDDIARRAKDAIDNISEDIEDLDDERSRKVFTTIYEKSNGEKVQLEASSKKALIKKISDRRNNELIALKEGMPSAKELEGLTDIEKEKLGIRISSDILTPEEIENIQEKEGRKVLVVNATRATQIGLKTKNQIGHIVIGDKVYTLVHHGRIPVGDIVVDDLIVDTEDTTIKTWLKKGELHAYDIVEVEKEIKEADPEDIDINMQIHRVLSSQYKNIKTFKDLEKWSKAAEKLLTLNSKLRSSIIIDGRSLNSDLITDMYNIKKELIKFSFDDVKAKMLLSPINPGKDISGPVMVVKVSKNQIIAQDQKGNELVIKRETFDKQIRGVVEGTKFVKPEITEVITGEDAESINETKDAALDIGDDSDKVKEIIKLSDDKTDDEDISALEDEPPCSPT